jgi:CBS domain-containing protein
MCAVEVDLCRVRVGDVMAPGIVSCSPEASAREVAATMAAKGIHCVVVMGLREAEEGVRGWGVISDLDLASAATGELDRITAAEFAATEPVEVKDTDTLEQASRKMVEHQVSHVLVTHGAPAQPIGVLSTLDLARALAGEAQRPPLVRTAGDLERLSEFAWVFIDVLGLHQAERRRWSAALHADHGFGPPFESTEALRQHLEAAAEATEVDADDVPIELITLLITFFAAHPDRHELSRRLFADALGEAFGGAELPPDVRYWLARHPGMVKGGSDD